MKDKEIKAFLKQLDLPVITEDELPIPSQQRDFLEAQINAVTKELTRLHFDLKSYQHYLTLKDPVAVEFAKNKLGEIKPQIRTYKYQLAAFLAEWEKLRHVADPKQAA